MRCSDSHQLGVFVTRDLQPGERIWKGEEKAVHIATQEWVRNAWGPSDLNDFERYAYPLGPQVYGFWDDIALDWRPYNHSCDPNAWFDGLNVVARRPIRAGDEVTLHTPPFSLPTRLSNVHAGLASAQAASTSRR